MTYGDVSTNLEDNTSNRFRKSDARFRDLRVTPEENASQYQLAVFLALITGRSRSGGFIYWVRLRNWPGRRESKSRAVEPPPRLHIARPIVSKEPVQSTQINHY